jgi:hypothetical protein
LFSEEHTRAVEDASAADDVGLFEQPPLDRIPRQLEPPDRVRERVRDVANPGQVDATVPDETAERRYQQSRPPALPISSVC